MTDTCPHCGPVLGADDVEVKFDELRTACVDAVAFDATVREADAAQLLCRSPKTLANWRFNGAGIPHKKIAGVLRYELRALAQWLLEHEQNCE
jgi:hypothetical protein